MDIKRRIKDRTFWALIAVCLFGSVIFVINAIINAPVVEIERKYAKGLAMGWLCFLSILMGILTAMMVYIPLKEDKTSTVFIALILYEVIFIWWSTILFHSRATRATATLSGMFFIVVTLWLGWVCYHMDRRTIYIFIVLLAWSLYMQNYTLNVDAHPWNFNEV